MYLNVGSNKIVIICCQNSQNLACILCLTCLASVSVRFWNNEDPFLVPCSETAWLSTVRISKVNFL